MAYETRDALIITHTFARGCRVNSNGREGAASFMKAATCRFMK
jgi:hypothetical protein